jgi:2,3-bisphosphoglycerate-dependent phosphoglycerate mutase
MNYTLLVFRHAETFDNSRGLFSGWRDSALTPKGKAQAEKIAKQLKHYKIDYAFTSHLKRARQTLNIVLKEHSPMPIFIDDRLIERCYGLLQGKNKKKIESEDPSFYERCHRGYGVVPPKGESLEMVEKRVLAFYAEITQWLKQNPGNVAISCHKNSIRPLRRVFETSQLPKCANLKAPKIRL